MKFMKIALLFTALILVQSCGDKEKKTESESESVKIGTKKTEKKSDDNAVSVGLAGNDAMMYDKSEIKVKAGQTVTLTLRHTGKLDRAAMGHNFVLLEQGVDINEFSLKAVEAGADNNWVPADGVGVIASTKSLGGGESTTITFTAPPAGTYDFICSFPGHSALMKGKFIVE